MTAPTSPDTSCLVISYGPVPTPQYQKIEGGGQRCWGLALGMKARGYDVTIAVNQSFPLDVESADGIRLINWQEDGAFKETLNLYDAVIINYSMGGPMSFVVDSISDHVTLVLDCYVPIYIEVSARESEDTAMEYKNYFHDIQYHNKALKRGDYFLCANIPQKHMYMGALGALGIINPYSYKKERVLVVPFGVESSLSIANPHNPYLDLGIKKTDFVLLWFGGLYPWFNITPLLHAIEKLSSEHKSFKFVIVGGKNPFNSHPDFVKQYTTTYDFIESHGLLNTSVHFVDWVDFSDRINWYRHAKAVISINNVGEENIYSWRTRVMDYVWGEVPMLTNGGDPLSESLINNKAAIQLADTKEATLYQTINQLIGDPSRLAATKKELLKQKELYYWENVVAPIDEKLLLNEKPYLEEKLFRQDLHMETQAVPASSGRRAKLRKLARAPRKIAGIVKRKGIKRSLKLATGTLSNRLQKTARHTDRRFYFFSHPIDFTGAPLVLLDIIDDYLKHVDKKSIALVYPGGERPLLQKVHKLGILTDKMVAGIGSRVIHAQLGIQKDDFVLLNTVAIYPNYRDYVLGLLEKGKLRKAVWFIHEDKPELRFEDKGLVARIKRLLAADLIDIYVPSSQTADDYNAFFETDKIKVMTLRVSVPEKYEGTKTAADFSKMKFIISGTPSDGRKGQLLAIAAFAKYQEEFLAKRPEKYRDFELHLLSIEDDYVSSQIKSVGTGLLGNKVSFYPKLKKEEAMDITATCNATICSSLNETFALYVAEGMLMGHVLLRNASSGSTEQIIDGKNGFLIDSDDIESFAGSIAKLTDKSLSNEKVAKMSEQSRKIAQQFIAADYWNQLNQGK